MTCVAITENQGIWRITAKGHAGYAEPGADIVCAAISILTFTLAQMTKSERHKLAHASTSLHPGDARVEIEPKEKYKMEISTTIRTIAAGYQMLQEQYPEHVQVMLSNICKS